MRFPCIRLHRIGVILVPGALLPFTLIRPSVIAFSARRDMIPCSDRYFCALCFFCYFLPCLLLPIFDVIDIRFSGTRCKYCFERSIRSGAGNKIGCRINRARMIGSRLQHIDAAVFEHDKKAYRSYRYAGTPRQRKILSRRFSAGLPPPSFSVPIS